ncbi:MAG: hypothetical protein P0S94_00310 [Simkaniaceae bacterium]|nr:hypothetical protein [Simkaniaceae bacterium]
MRFLFLLLFCAGCAMSAPAAFQKKGAKIAFQLAAVLQEVESKYDLIERGPLIQKKLKKLTALAIEAEKYAKKRPNDPFPAIFSTVESDRLQYEMMRVSAIDGCSDTLKKLQEPAFYKLNRS